MIYILFTFRSFTFTFSFVLCYYQAALQVFIKVSLYSIMFVLSFVSVFYCSFWHYEVYLLLCVGVHLRDCHVSSSRRRCGAALTPALSFPASTVRSRCFAVDSWVTRLSGGRQRQQAEDTLRSTSNHHRLSQCHGLSDRKKNQRRVQFFHRERNFNVFPQNHATGGYEPADINGTEDQKVATTTRKPQRRSSRCFFFPHKEGKTASGLRRSSEVGDSGRSNAHRFWWATSTIAG